MQVNAPASIVLQVAVSGLAGTHLDEALVVRRDGVSVELTEIELPVASRAHRVDALPGRLSVDYQATVTGIAAPATVSAADRIIYVRPSRYAESDRMAAVAQTEFAGITEPEELLRSVSSWVGSRLTYVPGSSLGTDGAVDTLLQGEGVCRDYAHLVVALLRALDVPARLVAVYAPGLTPMDFHAVAEAAIGDAWCVVDASLLAPRASLVRIATGRDAADTAFLSTYGGEVELLESTVTATTAGRLPSDDVDLLASLR